MPYNTRRKSLSLPSLGIHLPNTSRRSPSATKSPHATDDQLPPSKKVKRSHDSAYSLSPEPSSSSSARTPDGKESAAPLRQSGRRGPLEHTPPPSPTDGTVATKIDTEGINDDIVVGVIEQLEKTGNRPHLVKELAAVLIALNENVANSANPAALLSSRLSAYMKRPWTALAPCPLAKELVPIHPRKVYYYLTTLPRQPLPENSDDVIIPGVEGKDITPSVSSADLDEEDAMARERSRLSPSPEVDLSSPDFEEESIDLDGRNGPGGASRSGTDFNDHHHARLMHSNRAASPPLEGDEKEFTQTASAVRERASEQKGGQLQIPGGGFSALSEGLSELHDGAMSISDSVEDSPLSSISGDRMSDDQDGDYFSHNAYQQQSPLQDHLQQQQDLDDAAVATLFGTSPSPSLTSVASSISSGTSVASDDGLDGETQPETIGRTPQISLPEDLTVPPVSALKRSIDMLNSGLPDLDMKMSDLNEQDDKLPLGASAFASQDVEMVFDSWRELQSPETVEVDELDEMFGEI
ncbi:hypothetical protein BO85DRAFT_160477 [Aspergillus piperis CBS 112811]|uniref:GDS1 winged helix domain-containing protein n=2 Tax=Aspergillus subgen. Circumdati TaxID=2720871 RepID=A0A1L9N3I6_ASPTC|nr:hypothetical protein BO85DRAFT_160477 [Aspergillus piperis CBS 112811]OJI83853.1 hypothetical protein ASPTUDRAFT_29870 [Aspergillus tubingensis CBS 134.48]RAH53228.1 hypothetical protein BO85DRAFT_160477 [Aspergillus piperis CBS 112811]GLB05262.1 hypothetical protein AtubIFM57258_011300 [Aspergillus tubingensis]